MKRTRSKTKKTARKITKSIENREPSSKDEGIFLSSGSTLLNLSCTDTMRGAFKVGKIINIVGDSASGKTLLCLSALAEACYNPDFDDYNLVFDDSEASMEFDIPYLFGEKAGERIELYSEEDDRAKTVLDFVDHVVELYKKGKPFIYILDSMDSITTEAAQAKVQEQIEKREKAKGTYGMDKPKFLSNVLGDISRKIKDSNSIVIIISQTRDNIGMTFAPKTRSGGNALRFYSALELWLAMGETIKAKGRIIGREVRSQVKKNKVTGKMRTADFNIYYDYGIDDVRSCIDFLLKEGHWTTEKKSIVAKEFNMKGTLDKIIRYIEEKNGENRLRKIVEKVWVGIEDSIKLNRKRKYT